MKWPLVSRRAYDFVVEQNDRLMQHVIRMDRVEHGLTELQPEKKKREPVPDGVMNLIGGFASPNTQTMMLNEAKKQHRDGWSWEKIEEYLKREMGIA